MLGKLLVGFPCKVYNYDQWFFSFFLNYYKQIQKYGFNENV